MNDDGSMARRPDLFAFAKQHDLKIITIEDLIAYRKQNLLEHSEYVNYRGGLSNARCTIEEVRI